MYLGSDAIALGPFTDTISYLEDGDWVVLTRKSADIFDKDGNAVQRDKIRHAASTSLVDKANYRHFMAKEIHEQPGVVADVAADNADHAKKLALLIRESAGTYMIGCGTASYACLAGTYMFSKIAKRHVNWAIGSEFGYQLDFLTPEVAEKAKAVFKNYHQGISGQYRKMVSTPTTRKLKPFWEYVVAGQELLKIWGGPDSIEMGSDSLPEVVDYKYLQKGDESTAYLDMDLMPKVYTLLSAKELSDLGYQKIRFAVRLWHNPGNDSYYEEFDVSSMKNLEDFFKDKMERILRTGELSFCERDYCKACKSDKRREWIKELQKQGWIKD